MKLPKMNQKQTAIAYGAIALIVLFVVVALYFRGGIFAFGASIITLTPVQVQSNSPYWSDLTWQGNAVFNGGGQSVFGSTTAVNTLVQPPYTSPNTLKIDFEMTSEKLSYPLVDRHQPLYISSFSSDASKQVSFNCLYTRTHSAGDCVSGNQLISECGVTNPGHASDPYTNACKTLGANAVPAQCIPGDSGSRTCLFATVSKVADVYTLDPPKKPFSSRITFTSGGKSESIIISDTSPSATGTNIAGSVVGQLVGSGQNPPSETSAIAVNKATGGYALVPFFQTPSPMATSTDYWQKDSSPYGSVSVKEVQTLANERDQANSQVNSILGYSTPSSWTNVQVTPTNVVVDATNQPYYYPQVNFFVKASYLGIFIPASKPVMVSVNVPANMKAGVLGTATATIKNDGTQASIDVLLTCTNGVTVVSGNPFRVSSLGTGQAGTATWQLNENIAQGTSVTYACTAVATDANDPSIKSSPMTATGTAQGQPAPVCGNGVCEPPTENGGATGTCPADCGSGATYCTDGTQAGQCSYQKPLYCNNGVLQYKSGTCGCPSGLVANPDGTCGNGNVPSCPTGQKMCANNTCAVNCGATCLTGTNLCSDGSCKADCNPPDWTLIIVAGIGVLVLAVVYMMTRKK
jgi:hypothetical protein